MKKLLALVLAVAMTFAVVALVACGPTAQSETEKIIAEAQKMTLEELGRKAIEESKGKEFFGLGNSSRGKTALPYFIDWLKTLDPTYTLTYQWQQPKNNKIFDQLTADSKKETGTFAMTLIQDGNQIESKMVQTGILDTFIPKAWAEANGTTAEKYDGYLALQLLNKVFMYNCAEGSTKEYKNIWDFVREGEHGLFMDIDSEVVGKNFLYMLTKPEYAAKMKEAYNALSGAQKTYVDTAIAAVEQDAKDFGLDENGKYALAWIKLWVESYNAQSDDGPICNTLVDASAKDQFGLLVYSKLRSVQESASVSKNNVKVAAYDNGYVGLGGYGYCHYLFVTDNSPLPWTACAFIAYMTCVNEGTVPTTYKPDAENRADNWKIAGFEAWGKDIGGYSSNPEVARINETVFKHATRGGTEFPILNDKGRTWWEERLVVEDPAYCASVAFSVGSWIETLTKYTAK